MDESEEQHNKEFESFQEKIAIEGDMLKRYGFLIRKLGLEYKDAISWANEVAKISFTEEADMDTQFISIMLRIEYYLLSMLHEIKKQGAKK